MADIDQATFRAVMSAYPTGVTIVTAGHQGLLCGMAANSFTSVSLDPPLVLVCSQLNARTSEAAKASGRFAIHVMAHEQVQHVRAFVGRDAPRFARVEHDVDDHGTPVLRDWLALLVCELEQTIPAGDHEILVGEVVRCERRDREPLLFHDSALRMLPRLPAIRPGGPVLDLDEQELSDPLVRVLAPQPPRRSLDG